MVVHPVGLKQGGQGGQADADLAKIGQPPLLAVPLEIHGPAVADLAVAVEALLAAAAQVQAVGRTAP